MKIYIPSYNSSQEHAYLSSSEVMFFNNFLNYSYCALW